MTIEILALLGRGVVPSDTPVASADDTGLTRGDGCFEGLRIERTSEGSAVIGDLEAHLDRMARSAAALDIRFDRPAWTELAAAAGAAWAAPHGDGDEALVKFVLTRGRPDSVTPTGFVTISPQPAGTADWRSEGIDVVTLARGYGAEAFAGAPWLLGGVKTLSYAVNMAAQRWAQEHGADDIVFVGPGGVILEGPTSSVVVARGRRLSSPPPSLGILASISLGGLFAAAPAAGWDVGYDELSVADLLAADAVWLVSSIRLAARVHTLDGKALPEAGAGFHAELAALVGPRGAAR
jgi:4-amino-4-deoxychorismate lyase